MACPTHLNITFNVPKFNNYLKTPYKKFKKILKGPITTISFNKIRVKPIGRLEIPYAI